MPARHKSALMALLLGFGLCAWSLAQTSHHTRPAQNLTSSNSSSSNSSSPSLRSSNSSSSSLRSTIQTVTADDGLSVIAAALDPKVRRGSTQDCSHLVHTIYEKAGFPYVYASSYDLYDGVEGFLRVWHPQPGDVIVWQGHTGIVVRPSRHLFFSFMRSGPGVSDYESNYWAARGEPRFYRYIKNGFCAGCTTASNRIHPYRSDR